MAQAAAAASRHSPARDNANVCQCILRNFSRRPPVGGPQDASEDVAAGVNVSESDALLAAFVTCGRQTLGNVCTRLFWTFSPA
ncbi:hypothetical protein F2P81_016231 [Scophthalmus maximus]|uniref:Uncharacterized protein n=1 Tax=Scophthalmus maximus TaxID=52904 RepID=A0A6A4S8Y3_SCOMX|nr:hypothetical protein F2P81_016231 [Scophthalmus maximus]